VAHTCNLSYLGGKRSGRSRFEASPGKEFTIPYLEKSHHKKRAGRVAQGIGPEFKPQYCKKEKEKEKKTQCQCLVISALLCLS
jgi:hypothetical protein